MNRALKLVGAIVAVIAFVSASAPPDGAAAEIRTWELQDPEIDLTEVKLGVSVARRSLYPKTPRDALRVNVMLPDGYDGKRKFPVLYLLHGGGWGYDFWADPEGGDLLATAVGLRAIVVMPEGGRGWYTNWWSEGARTDPGWQSFHLERVIAEVERRLEVRRGRRWHSIAGFSMGGLGALNYAAELPGYFGSAASLSGIISIQRPESPTAFDGISAALSGSVDGPGAQPETHRDVFGDFDEQAFYWSGHNPVARAANLAHTRVFVTVGDGTPYSSEDLESTSYGTPIVAAIEGTIREYAGDFEASAREAGVPLTVNRRAGFHTNFAARLGLREALDWGLFNPVAAKARSFEYSTVSTEGRMWALGYRFASPPADVVSFAREGRILSASGGGQPAPQVKIERRRCAVTVQVPFELDLRRACRVAGERAA